MNRQEEQKYWLAASKKEQIHKISILIERRLPTHRERKLSLSI